jgi:hypothetical protein
MNHTFSGVKDGFENTPKVGVFYNTLLDMDLRIGELLLERSGDILSESTSDYGIIDTIYGRIVQTPSSDEYDPYCKVKLPTMYDQPSVMKTSVYNNGKNPLRKSINEFQEYMKDHTWVKTLVKFQFLYYINGKIYPSLDAYQQKVFETDVGGTNKNADMFV